MCIGPSLAVFQPFRYLLLVLQYVHDYLQCNIGTLIGACYIVRARRMQSLKYRVRHFLRYEFRGTDPSLELECSQLSCATWDVHLGIGRLYEATVRTWKDYTIQLYH